MKYSRILSIALALTSSWPAAAKVQPFVAGWDVFNEPLNYSASSIKWSASPKSKSLAMTFTLVGAKPTKLYQLSVALFCSTPPAAFGRFPVDGACQPTTRQGVTKSATAVEVGVILTDSTGAGTFTLSTGPLIAGKYQVEFTVRDGAGCNVTGGGSDCNLDFQSPGPFGTTSNFTVK